MPDPRQTHRFGVIVGCAAVLAAASQALGNPGTTGWTVIAHMIVGNLVIGVAEGLIARQLGAGWWAVPILIVVNYLSAAAGMAAASWAFEPLVAALHDDPLRAVGTASWLAMGVLALLGLVLEAPAFLVCFVRREGMLRRAALALVAGNAATNIGVLCWYWITGASSLLTALRPVDSAAEVLTGGNAPWVYYIASDERTIRRIRADGAGDEVVWSTSEALVVEPRGPGDWAGLRAIPRPDGGYALAIKSARVSGLERPTWMWRSERDQSVSGVAVLEVGAAASLFGEADDWHWGPAVGDAADLRPDADRAVTVDPHWDGVRGVTIEGPQGTRSLALDNGFIRRSFTPCNVSVLPGDILVFELNHENGHTPRGMYIASLRDNRIARLGAGRSPIVVYESRVEGWTPPKER